ncbi:MAG: hypothetical protein H7240_13155 [Glaciimonas sp.]|nr:hypothetical protein [Glaciimonas sp.]
MGGGNVGCPTAVFLTGAMCALTSAVIDVGDTALGDSNTNLIGYFSNMLLRADAPGTNGARY